MQIYDDHITFFLLNKIFYASLPSHSVNIYRKSFPFFILDRKKLRSMHLQLHCFVFWVGLSSSFSFFSSRTTADHKSKLNSFGNCLTGYDQNSFDCHDSPGALLFLEARRVFQQNLNANVLEKFTRALESFSLLPHVVVHSTSLSRMVLH